jgi:hypothetical protein
MSKYYIMQSKNKDNNYDLVEIIEGNDIREVRKIAYKKYGSHTQVWRERKYKFMFEDGE